MLNEIDDIVRRDKRQSLINLVPGFELGYITRRKGLKKDVILILIGERGGGKSGSGAVISLVDYMMCGVRCYSNMTIACDVEVSDKIAQKYGFTHGGVARYRSLPLDIPKLLRFDPTFSDSLIFIDEINVEVSEARRSMTNTNLFSNRLAQELRHMESALIGTCISEMVLDSRLRDIVDCYIRSEETAYYPDSIRNEKAIGEDFGWKVFYMNKCFTGETYADVKVPNARAVFHFKPWRGIYDDKEFQGAGMLKYGVDIKEGLGKGVSIDNMGIAPSPVVSEHKNKWGWFEPIYLKYSSTQALVPCENIWNESQVVDRHIYKNDITHELRSTYNVPCVRLGAGRTPYYDFRGLSSGGQESDTQPADNTN